MVVEGVCFKITLIQTGCEVVGCIYLP